MKETGVPLKTYFLLFLLVFLWAGKAAAQVADTTVPMKGELREVEIRNPLVKWKKDYAENRLLYKKELRYATLKPTRKFFAEVGAGRIGYTFNDFWSVLALKASGKQKKFLKFKTEMERNETEDLAAIRYSPALVRRVTGAADSAAQAFIEQNPMSREFLMTATDLELLQWIRDRQKKERKAL